MDRERDLPLVVDVIERIPSHPFVLWSEAALFAGSLMWDLVAKVAERERE